MILELAMILLCGMFFGMIFKKMKLPPLFGMLIAGLVIGNSGFSWISIEMQQLAITLRKIALIIILVRAGLQLNLSQLKEQKWTVLLMSFLPALFEIGGITLIGVSLFQMQVYDALLIGTILAAVSPAIIVPKMLKLVESEDERVQKVAQLILSAASLDDIVVVTLFGALTSLSATASIATSFMTIVQSIVSAIVIGIIAYFGSVWMMKKLTSQMQIIFVFAVSLFLVGSEEIIQQYLPYASLLSVLTFNMAYGYRHRALADEWMSAFQSLWSGAEILLFVSIGISIDIRYVVSLGIMPILIVFGGMIIRSLGTFVTLQSGDYRHDEQVFAIISFLPKATVQAALASIPLSMGMAIGEQALSIGFVAILISAPLGALLMDAIVKKQYQIHL